MLTTRRNLITSTAAVSAFYLSNSAVFSGKVQAAEMSPILEAAKQLASGGQTLRILYPQGSIENIKPVANLFSSKTGVAVEFVETTVDEINIHMLNSAAQGASNYDIALPATFGIPDLVEAGAIADLTEHATKYEPIASFGQSLYSLGDTYKNRKYGYQTDGDVYLMFYNNELLKNSTLANQFADAHGRELALPNTWAELDLQMEFFHDPDKSRFGGCMFRTPIYVLWEWWIRMHALGGYPVTDGFGATTASDAGVAALEDLFRMTAFQHPTVSENGLFDNWRVYGEGQCYANIGWGGTQKYLNSDKSSVKGKLSYSPTPQVSYFNWGWNYVVSKFSSNQELAYLFCLLASLPITSTEAVRNDGFFDPFRSEHYEDPEIKKVYSESFLDAHKKGMTDAIPDFYVEGQGRYLNTLRDNIASALQGIITPKEALEFTDIQWNGITEEIGVDRQIEQWNLLKSSYP